MKIKRFFENEMQGPEGKTDLLDISKDRVDEIIKELEKILDQSSTNLITLKKFEKELSKYKSKSTKSNDQIDDSVAELGRVNNFLENDVIDIIDSIIETLKQYNKEGRSYIYQV